MRMFEASCDQEPPSSRRAALFGLGLGHKSAAMKCGRLLFDDNVDPLPMFDPTNTQSLLRTCAEVAGSVSF